MTGHSTQLEFDFMDDSWQSIYKHETFPYYQSQRGEILAVERERCINEAYAHVATSTLIEFLAEDDAKTLSILRQTRNVLRG